ncbi:hypothetical protein F5Y14DRAFT_170137 [Nemania sp. NC0429]|nr:hypothetical protein F5Y14DRAFT_170137 [Nemania sp. NC0429]
MDPPVDAETLPHDNRGYVLISAVVVVVSVASLSTALRIYTRACLIKKVGADDYLALLALALAIATGVSECVNTRHGLGKHVWDLEAPGEIVAYFKNFYVNIAFYNAGLMVVKLTFLTQYYRVLVLRRFQTICIVAMIAVGAWGLSQLLVGLFICTPVASFWDRSMHHKCVPFPLQWYINAGGNIISDIIVFVLPLPVISHLKLPRAQRLTLVAIFSLGFFTCAISVVRIKFLKQGGDFSYQNVEASSWSITELCSGVTCVCLPTLRPLVSKFIPRLAGPFQRSSSGYRRHSGSRESIAAQEGKHTRQGSNESNVMRVGSEDGLCRAGASLDAVVGRNREASDSGIGFQITKKGLCGDGGASLKSPAPAYLPAQIHARSNSHPGWMRPCVTTTISAGIRAPEASCRGSSTIHVTRDIMLREIPLPKA